MIRRIGIENGAVVFVSPAFEGAFAWETIDYYENKLISDIKEALKARHPFPLSLGEIEETITKAPPLGDRPMLSFIRAFPEYFKVIPSDSMNSMAVFVREEEEEEKT